jgi:hypothetical protein
MFHDKVGRVYRQITDDHQRRSAVDAKILACTVSRLELLFIETRNTEKKIFFRENVRSQVLDKSCLRCQLDIQGQR